MTRPSEVEGHVAAKTAAADDRLFPRTEGLNESPHPLGICVHFTKRAGFNKCVNILSIQGDRIVMDGLRYAVG